MVSRARWGRRGGRFNGSAVKPGRQLEADLVAEVCGGGAKKTFAGTTVRIRTKTDTGRHGEYPKALERTVLKELGNLTP